MGESASSLGEPTPAPAAPGARRAVAYVLTNYPQFFVTFIADEIRAMEARGVEVLPISMNSPAASDLVGAHERRERDRTFYLKALPKLRALGILLRALVRHPVALARTLGMAVRTAGLDLKGALWRVFHVAEGVLVWDRCRRAGVRHVHAHFGLTPATIAWFAAAFGNHAGERWTWSFTIHGFQDFVNEREAALAPKAESASHVVCVSDFTRSQIMRISRPAVWDRFHVVRCGIDLQQFRFAPREQLGAPPTVLIVGRISPEKGHGVLLHAVSRLRREGLPVVVEVAGDGPFRAELQAEAARLGVADQVRFLGAVPPAEVPERLRAADVFCLPSFSEGLPVSIMEAMAVGTPVLTTYISGIPELAVDGETAMVVPAGNAELLAAALARLLREPELRRRVAHAARRRVELQHSLSENVRSLEALLARAADPAPVPRELP